jgi:hypothetical protein
MLRRKFLAGIASAVALRPLPSAAKAATNTPGRCAGWARAERGYADRAGFHQAIS